MKISTLKIDPELVQLAAREGRFRPDAYDFLLQCVQYVMTKMERPRHISALELLTEVKNYAEHCFGPFAGAVLHEWGVECGVDVGKIVYDLIAIGRLSADKDDSPEDFAVDFDLLAFPEVSEKPIPIADMQGKKEWTID